jgi:hypothetical protein
MQPYPRGSAGSHPYQYRPGIVHRAPAQLPGQVQATKAIRIVDVFDAQVDTTGAEVTSVGKRAGIGHDQAAISICRIIERANRVEDDVLRRRVALIVDSGITCSAFYAPFLTTPVEVRPEDRTVDPICPSAANHAQVLTRVIGRFEFRDNAFIEGQCNDVSLPVYAVLQAKVLDVFFLSGKEDLATDIERLMWPEAQCEAHKSITLVSSDSIVPDLRGNVGRSAIEVHSASHDRPG